VCIIKEFIISVFFSLILSPAADSSRLCSVLMIAAFLILCSLFPGNSVTEGLCSKAFDSCVSKVSEL